MRKRFALMMALTMTGSMLLTGCGGSSAKAPETKAPAAETEAVETEAPETEAAETEAVETEAPENAAPETTAAESEPSAEEAFAALGNVDGNVYTNDHFGLRFEAVDTWYIATPEQIAQLSGMAADAIEDEDLADKLLNSGVVYDFYAMDTSDNTNINIALQDIGLFGSILVNTTVDIAEKVKPQVEQAYKQAGYEMLSCETSTQSFMGEDVTCLTAHIIAQGNEMYQRQVYKAKGNYLAVITATGLSDEASQAALEMFK